MLNLLKITKNRKSVTAELKKLSELLEKIAAVISEKTESHDLILNFYDLLVETVEDSGQIIETLFKIGELLWANRNQDFTHFSSIDRESSLNHVIVKDNSVNIFKENSVSDFILSASDFRKSLLNHAMTDLHSADTSEENSVCTSCTESNDDDILKDIIINKKNSSATSS